jgi:hypothetical protein
VDWSNLADALANAVRSIVIFLQEVSVNWIKLDLKSLLVGSKEWRIELPVPYINLHSKGQFSHVGTGVSFTNQILHPNEKPLSVRAIHALPVHTDRVPTYLLLAGTSCILLFS